MTEHSVGELQNWAESLRDRVSRVSGRAKTAAAAGFNAELKGDLLDAIDLLLEQVQDPQEEPAPEWLHQVPSLFAEPMQDWQSSLANALTGELAKPLEDWQTGFAASLSQELTHALGSLLNGEVKESLAAQLGNQVATQIASSVEDGISQSTAGPWKDSLAESLSSAVSGSVETSFHTLGEHLDANLAEALSQSLKDSLSRSVAEALTLSLEQSLEQSLGQNLEKTLDHSVGQAVGHSLEQTLEQSLASVLEPTLARALEPTLNSILEPSLTTALAPALANLDSLQSGPDVSEIQAGVAAAIKGDLDQLREQSQESREAEEKTTFALQALNERHRTLAEQQQSLQEQLKSYETLLGQLKDQTTEALASGTEQGWVQLAKQSKDQSAETKESFDALTNELRQHGLVDPAFMNSLEQELADAKQEVEDQRRRLADLDGKLAEHHAMAAEHAELSETCRKLQEQFHELENEVATLQTEKGELEEQLSSRDQEMESLRQETAEARDELSRCREELEQTSDSMRNELTYAQDALQLAKENEVELQAKLESASTGEGDNVSESEVEELLSVARQELEDLRNQNSDLAAQLAKQQVLQSNSAAQAECDEANLSWEDRKRLIMQQFQDEEESSPNRIEMEQVIASTERELEKREEKIAELQNKLEESNNAPPEDTEHDEAIDQDEIIQREREKLKSIQEEWEQKLRQAEIDLSMERAKLARERTELESAKAEKQPEEKPDKGRTRKWLDHLGLREEHKE